MKNHSAGIVILLLAALIAPAGANAAEKLQGAGQWDEATLALFDVIPVQDGGRNKPFQTYASFTLLPLNGKRSVTTPGGQKIGPTAWMLDCLFFPEDAAEYKHFVIDNTEVLTNIGISVDEARGRYSYNQLQPGRAQLIAMARQYAAIERAEQSNLERQTLNLADNLLNFEALTHFLEFARHTYSVEQSVLLSEVFPEKTGLSLGQIFSEYEALRRWIATIRAQSRSAGRAEFVQRETAVFQSIFHKIDMADAIAFIPKTHEHEETWATPSDMAAMLLAGDAGNIDAEVEILASLERLAKTAQHDKLAFRLEAQHFHDITVDQAKARGEYGKIPLEVTFYNANFFYRALVFFIISFVLVALSWLAPSRIMDKVVGVSVVIPWALLTAGIVFRCVIQGRPPVTTLYETILFIVATGVLVALFIEYANRQRIAIAFASLMGVVGMFIANRYELSEARDTMPSLGAVLDTNFWLATHVTTITIGYAAGMLGSAISHLYIFGKLFNLKKSDASFYDSITRMVFGVVCFGLLFSFIGTVLGGIWANYSWGRFWGWDPKENGALLIVLCMLAIVHARAGGYIRSLGLHVASVFTGCVVLFSHFGVNLLGVGLHSYGFTSGVWRNLAIFWAVETVVMLLGIVIFLRANSRGSQPQQASEAG